MPSSVIRAMRYRPKTRTLEIVFRGGRGTYRYFDVPVEEWRRFRAAPSKGTYLNAVFKARGFGYERAEALPAAAPRRGRGRYSGPKEHPQSDSGADPLYWGEAAAFPEVRTGQLRGGVDKRNRMNGLQPDYPAAVSLRRSVSR